MWVIQDISLLFKYTNDVRHPWSLNIGHKGGFSGTMSVVIYDTEHDCIERWVSSKCESIMDFLRHHKPYGFIDMTDKDQDYSYLVVIDKTSLDFRKYVKSVDIMRYVDGNESLMSQLDDIYDFVALNADKSLFLCKTSESETACTLFQTVSFFSRCMDGENAYIAGPFGDAFVDYGDDAHVVDMLIDAFAHRQIYKVNFSDYRAATRLVSKYVTLKKNPLVEWVAKH